MGVKFSFYFWVSSINSLEICASNWETTNLSEGLFEWPLLITALRVLKRLPCINVIIIIVDLRFQPKLSICNQIVPAVKFGDSFKYGRFFYFEMSNQDHKSKLISLFLPL